MRQPAAPFEMREGGRERKREVEEASWCGTTAATGQPAVRVRCMAAAAAVAADAVGGGQPRAGGDWEPA